MRFEDRKVKKMSELINIIYKDLKEIKNPIWYRGHSAKSSKLLPLICRGNYDNNSEMNLIKKFKQNATLLIEQLPTESYEWLFIMRHFGVPTRLLDWSESPLVAAYFAVNGDMNKEGVLWALSPIELNKQGGRKLDDPDNLPSFGEDSEIQAYTPESCQQEKMTKLLPIAFIAPRNTPRMQAQLSTFTIYHRDRTPLENIGDKTHLWRYIIPKSAKKRIKRELELLGIGEFQLYPELESLGKKLRDE